MSKTQKETENKELPVLNGQLSLDDILSGRIVDVDDGTYGKPADEFIVEVREEIRS